MASLTKRQRSNDARIFLGICPDKDCQAKLYFPCYDQSIECTRCGQRHDRSNLKNIQEVTDYDVAVRDLVKDLLLGKLKEKKGFDSVKVLGLSDYVCKLISPILTYYGMDRESGKARLLSEMGKGSVFDVAVLGDRAFLIEDDKLDTAEYGKDRTGGVGYLAETLKDIASFNDNETCLVPIHADGDGHCLVHAVSRALVGRELFWHALRVNLKNHIRGNLDRYRMLFHDFVDKDDWESIIEECDPEYIPPEGEAAGLRNIHIFGLANVLRRPIVLLDAKSGMNSSGDYSGVFLPGLIPPEQCKGKDGTLNKPLCIAWSSLGHNHYIPVVGIKGRGPAKLPSYMLQKSWGMPREEIKKYVEFDHMHRCVVGGDKCLSDRYLRQLVSTMEEVFLQKNEVSPALVADVRHYIFKHSGVVGIHPDDVVLATLTGVAEKRLYRCCTCQALMEYQLSNDLFVPGGNLYQLAVSIHGTLNPDKLYSFPLQGAICSYDADLDCLIPNTERSQPKYCAFCKGDQVRLVKADNTVVYKNNDRTRTPCTGGRCTCGYKHYYEGKEYDNLPEMYPISLQWGGKHVTEEIAWFQYETDPTLNSNVFEVAQSVVQKHFPGEFGSERLVQRVVDTILAQTARAPSKSSEDQDVPKDDPEAWSAETASKIILTGHKKKTIHKEELMMSEKEKEVRKKVQANAPKVQQRKTIELAAQKAKVRKKVQANAPKVQQRKTIELAAQKAKVRKKVQANAPKVQQRKTIELAAQKAKVRKKVQANAPKVQQRKTIELAAQKAKVRKKVQANAPKVQQRKTIELAAQKAKVRKKVQANAPKVQQRKTIELAAQKAKVRKKVQANAPKVQQRKTIELAAQKAKVRKKVQANAPKVQQRKTIELAAQKAKTKEVKSPRVGNTNQSGLSRSGSGASTSASSSTSVSESVPGGSGTQPPANEKKVRLSTSDGRQAMLTLVKDVTYTELQQLIQQATGVAPAQQKIRMGHPPKLLEGPGEGEQEPVVQIHHGDKLVLEVLPDTKRVKDLGQMYSPPNRSSQGSQGSWGNFEEATQSQSADRMLQALRDVPHTGDSIDQAIASIAVLCAVTGKDVWTYAQSAPHLFSIGGLFYSQVKRDIGLVDGKHYQLEFFPGKVFQYSSQDDRLLLCLEPYGHFNIEPNIEQRVKDGGFHQATMAAAHRDEVKFGASGAIHHAPERRAFCGQGHSLKAADDRMPVDLACSTRKSHTRGFHDLCGVPGRHRDSITEEPDDMQVDETDPATPENRYQRLGPGYSVLDSSATANSNNTNLEMFRALAASIEKTLSEDIQEEDETSLTPSSSKGDIQGEGQSTVSTPGDEEHKGTIEVSKTASSDDLTTSDKHELHQDTEQTHKDDTENVSIADTATSNETVRKCNRSAESAMAKDSDTLSYQEGETVVCVSCKDEEMPKTDAVATSQVVETDTAAEMEGVAQETAHDNTEAIAIDPGESDSGAVGEDTVVCGRDAEEGTLPVKMDEDADNGAT